MSSPEISIIIPTLKYEEEFGWEDRLAESAVDAELLVKTDGSASEARNAGIREASTNKLVFLDDDSVPQEGYFERVSSLLEEHPAVTGRIRDTGSPYTRSLSTHYDQGDVGHTTDRAVGCNMAIRREVLEDIGCFDERLPYGHEEAELIDRVNEAYDIWYCPDLVVDHPFANSLRDYFEKSYRHGYEAVPYFVLRGDDLHRRMLTFIFSPSRYLKSSPVGIIGQLVSVVGLLRGYVEYRLGKRDLAN